MSETPPEELAAVILAELVRQSEEVHCGPFVRQNHDGTVTVDGSVDIVALSRVVSSAINGG